jgi:hypothetical protein
VESFRKLLFPLSVFFQLATSRERLKSRRRLAAALLMTGEQTPPLSSCSHKATNSSQLYGLRPLGQILLLAKEVINNCSFDFFSKK